MSMDLEITDIPRATHPYGKKLEEQLSKQKHMLYLLETRLFHIDRKITPKIIDNGTTASMAPGEWEKTADPEFQYEVNELAIKRIKTEGEIDVLKRVISEKENYFRQYMIQFEKDIKEVNEKYEMIIATAKKSTKPNIQKILATVVWERIEGDDEAKIALYKQIRKYL